MFIIFPYEYVALLAQLVEKAIFSSLNYSASSLDHLCNSLSELFVLIIYTYILHEHHPVLSTLALV